MHRFHHQTAEEKLEASYKLLHAIQEAQRLYISHSEPIPPFRFLLEKIVELTESDFGFIAELLHRPDGHPYIKTIALTNISWNEKTQALYDQYAPLGFEFDNMNTLYGEVVQTERPVISNDPAHDPRSGGLPEGHPPLKSFLGVPVFSENTQVGLFCVAGREGGYSPEQVEALEPFLTTCSSLIQAYRNESRRQVAEEKLRRQQQETQIIFNAAPAMIWYKDGHNKILRANALAAESFGMTPEEMEGKSAYELYPDEARQYHQDDREVIQSGKPKYGIIERYPIKTGEKRWVQTDKVPFRDARGEIQGVIVFAVDITDRIQAGIQLSEAKEKLEQRVEERTEELHRVNEQLNHYIDALERSNRELEDFASIASHDLQEPLRKVVTYTDRLSSLYTDQLDDQGKNYLRRTQNAAERMRQFIEDLLQYSRVTTKAKPFQSTSLEDVIQEVVCDLEATLESSGGSVDVRSLPVVEADPFQMRQMFQNLIANALKFHRQAAPSRVTLDSRPNGDGTWTIWIQDNGIGFEEKYLGRIFKPFERLHGKNEFSGSGMGLAICRKIIQRHGGTITAESRVNEGTRFVITLPEKQT